MTTKEAHSEEDFERLLEEIRALRGFDFRAYKRTTLRRRIHKRLEQVNIDSYDRYMAQLEADPDEFTHLFNTILINVTGFFRDPDSWQFLAGDIIPAIARSRHDHTPIRVWSAGCASGEEAYSVAMLFAEQMGLSSMLNRVKIYATDLDDEALATARHGTFPLSALADVPQQLRDKYFQIGADFASVRKDLRRTLIFGRHDLLHDAPISRVDLLICRNTLMYFNSDSQRRILERFHFALNERAYLFLGKSEMLLTSSNLFTPHDLRWRVFTRTSHNDRRDRLYTASQAMIDAGQEEYQPPALTEMAFDYDTSAQICVDPDHRVVLINRRAREFFRLGAADVGRPFHDLDISYRPVDLRSSLDAALTHRHAQEKHDVRMVNSAGDATWFNVHVMPLIQQDNLLGANIQFIETTELKRLQQGLEESHHELETTGEELQSTNEELETTNEELQSAVEELETTNEELQSTNEELETMNEELQATNEELETVNDELRVRTDESNRTNVFLESILRSVRLATVVLDEKMEVQVWNDYAEELWGLRDEDVRGRNFFALEMGLPVQKLKPAITAGMTDGVRSEEIEVEGHNRVGSPIKVKASVYPLTSELVVEATPIGVIILLEETSPEP